jgi:outer membrane protein assembly factor BamB
VTSRVLALAFSLLVAVPLLADWTQFAGDARHTGSVAHAAQPLGRVLADVVYDPFVKQQMDETEGVLLTHYAAPVVEGTDVYMEFKSGVYTGFQHWETQNWSIHKLQWEGETFVDSWTAPSDWKPVPANGLVRFEPVFHAALANGFLYEPGAGGTLLQIAKDDGHLVRRINPFGETVNRDIYLTSALTVDATGNIYYTATAFDSAAPWTTDIGGAWLVKVTPDGSATTAEFSRVITGAPAATSQCTTSFAGSERPWPPSPNAVPPSIMCGSQRPGVNAAPAIAADGTIYIVSHAHFTDRWSYIAAVNADLSPKWTATLRNRFNDGCGVLTPINNSNNGCRTGAHLGVDPQDNAPGSGRVADDGTSSPIVAPDGTIYYGAQTRWNGSQGHLMRFDAQGQFLSSYTFGWDTTPAIWSHGGTFSLITKENRYFVASYYMTQLSPNLQVEWQLKATNTNACGRTPDGSIACVDLQESFEWCVNAPAVDANGTVYVNSEDGRLYAIAQGGRVIGSTFLQLALGAGYTPMALGSDGRIYAQNAGHLFVVGSSPLRRRVAHQ